MCLGVPGRVESVTEDALGLRMGRVSFGGIVKEVCLAYVPEAEVGDHVLVHVGFGLSVIDEEEARRTLETLATMGELSELRTELDRSPGRGSPGRGPPGRGPSGAGPGAP
jgi:hydrogenase expression/formation protein HypC